MFVEHFWGRLKWSYLVYLVFCVDMQHSIQYLICYLYLTCYNTVYIHLLLAADQLNINWKLCSSFNILRGWNLCSKRTHNCYTKYFEVTNILFGCIIIYLPLYLGGKFWSSGKGQARTGKGWPLRRRALKLNPCQELTLKLVATHPPTTTRNFDLLNSLLPRIDSR